MHRTQGLARVISTGIALLTALLLVGCGSSGGSSDGSSAAGSSEAGSAGSSGTESQDGTVRWGDGSYGVVLAHGAAFDASSWEEQATEIADVGASVIAVEDISPNSIKDAVETLKDEGHQRVALVGGSAGSDAILQLSTDQPDLADQLILLSPNGTVEGLGEQPKLFIASEDEPGAHVSTELAASAPGEDNKAVLLPGSAHAQNIFDTDQGPKVLGLILDRIEMRATG